MATYSDLSTLNNTCFCSNRESLFGCARLRRLRLVFWLFTSCVWYVLQYRILKKTASDFFLETWSSSFCIVCNWFDDFRKNHPKSIGLFHQKESTNFAKRRWVRFKIVFLSSALLFALVVVKKYVLRTSWGLCLEKYVFFVQMQSQVSAAQFPKVRFGTLALYILRFRCLVMSNTYKNSFCFCSKTETFQNNVGYIPKMSV